MNELQLATLCSDIYDKPESFDSVISNDYVFCGRTGNTIVFRGTDNIADAVHDMEAVIPLYVPLVGMVCDGFYAGIEDIFDRLNLRAGDAVELTAHSLGCAHAAYIARWALLRGIAVTNCVLFEPPICGNQEFLDGLHNVKRLVAYPDGNDIVCSLPHPSESLPLVQFQLTPIGTTEKLGGEIDDHLISSVIASLAAIS